MSDREKFLKRFKEKTGREFTPDLVYKYSDYLLRYFHEYFDEWWDPDKFDWDSLYYLVVHCNEHFDKWWDPCRYNWDYSSRYLPIHCSEHFDKWWNPDKFNWSYINYLQEHCQDHFQWKLDGIRLRKIDITDLDPKDIAKIKNLGRE